MSIISDVRAMLLSLSYDEYKEFSQGLIPTNTNTMLGVRLPQLRKLAGEIVKKNWREFLGAYELNVGEKPYYEEVLLQGMVINVAKMEIGERLDLVKNFIPKIDNWAVCDTFSCGAKWVAKSRDEVWGFLQQYLASDKEFEVRYGVIMLLAHFLDKEYIGEVLPALDSILVVRREYICEKENTGPNIPPVKSKKSCKCIPPNYYVEMAVAWCLATAAAKCREEFLEYIKKTNLHPSVLKKAAQKMRDSYRVSDEDKKFITELINGSIN